MYFFFTKDGKEKCMWLLKINPQTKKSSQHIPVDSFILSQHSSFLQQAAHLTGGIYLRASKQEGLIQYLLACYTVDNQTRQYLNLPVISVIDYRASCFCCKKVIESGIGWVCSVCLSSKWYFCLNYSFNSSHFFFYLSKMCSLL